MANRHAPAISVLKRASSKDVQTDPFPHLHIVGALPKDYYQRLAKSFPGRQLNLDGLDRPQNSAWVYTGVKALENPELFPTEWVAFMLYHLSGDFFREIFKLFANHFRAAYPDFEARLGVPLNKATVGPRFQNAPWDIKLDCQFGVNAPVTIPSTVRGPHIDGHKKLFNALLYLRAEDDDSTGGDFEIYRWKTTPRFGEKDDPYAVPDDLLEPVGLIPYKANSLVLFLNSPTSVHGVTERGITSVPRQYINFLAEARIPVFSLPRNK